ncbi:MAG: V-type ATP synthase subunit F [Oscillospiraceae bacterium]|jgi:V/A-type H+-transporting ATPase subunit F|nr:V-type ATP synthase subunit F [Oscillospiraceae bacterium]
MKFFVISDNVDTRLGLRLAGIEGVVVHEAAELEKALAKAAADPEVGVVLMTAKLMALCKELVYDIKLNRRKPLISEIPDRHGEGQIGDSLSAYVREAIGINF